MEGKPAAILATMQNKTAVRDGVLTAVNDWLLFINSFRTSAPVPSNKVHRTVEALCLHLNTFGDT